MTNRLGLPLILARRFFRGRSLPRTSLVMFAVAVFLIGMFVTLQAFTLTGSQVVERDLGRFDSATDLGSITTVKPGDGGLTRDLVAAMAEAGVEDYLVASTSVDVKLSTVDAPHTPFLEADWSRDFLSGRYGLLDGRWPTSPGEVVVTGSAAPHLGDDLSVLAGATRFRVVGVAEDRYAQVSSILAAPGTWASLSPTLSQAFPTLEASVSVYWNGGEDRSVVAAVSEALAPRAQVPNLSDLVVGSTRTADQTADAVEASWLDRIPAAYTLPALILPVLGVVLVFSLNDRRFRRAIGVVTSIGGRPAQAVAGIAVATAAWAVIATLVGAAAGFGLGVAARPIVQRYQHQPLSPLPPLGVPVLQLVVMTLVGAVLSAFALRASLRLTGPAPRRAPVSRKRLRDVRHVLVVLAGITAVAQVANMDSVVEGMVFAATVTVFVLLVTPELMGLVLTRLPRRGARTRLGRSRLLADRHASTAVVVLAAVLGAPLGFLMLLDSMTQSEQARLQPDVAPGQVALCGRGGYLEPPSAAVVDTARSGALADRPPIRLRYLGSAEQPVSLQGSDYGFILAIDSPEQVAALIGRDLPSAAADTLRQGGLVVWSDTGRSSRRILRRSENRTTTLTDPLPAAVAAFPAVAWQKSTTGVVLTATARDLRLPTSDGALFYTGLPDGTPEAARESVLAAGLDPKEVLVHATPRAAVTPAAVTASALGLVLLALLTSVAVTRGRVRTLRDQLGTLIAIGAPIRWARGVLLFEQSVLTAVSIAVAAVIAFPPVLVSAWRLPGFVLSIPWGWAALVVAAFAVTVAGATLISSRRLRASG
jgi:hypothetical protein